MPIETSTPASRIRPTLDWVAASCSKLEGRSFTADGDHRDPRGGDLVRNEPAFDGPDEHQLQQRIVALEVEDVEDVARPLDMDQQVLPPLQHRHERRGVEARQEHILAAPGVRPIFPGLVRVADDRAVDPCRPRRPTR